MDVGILEGGINNTANEEVAHKMRKRCKMLVALGDCAVFGGVPAMRNFFTIEEALRRAYVETESTDSEGKIPDDPELAQHDRSARAAGGGPGGYLRPRLPARRGHDLLRAEPSWPRAANPISMTANCQWH